MHMNMSQGPFFAEISPEKGAEMRRTRPRPTLCASLRDRNARGHVTTHENIFLRIYMLKPALQPTLCASLRGRNAHGQNTRTILCRNLQGKCRAREGTSIKHRPLPLPQEPLNMDTLFGKKSWKHEESKKRIERRRDENRDKTHKWRKDAWMVLIFAMVVRRSWWFAKRWLQSTVALFRLKRVAPSTYCCRKKRVLRSIWGNEVCAMGAVAPSEQIESAAPVLSGSMTIVSWVEFYIPIHRDL